jgi:hypothetical protein
MPLEKPIKQSNFIDSARFDPKNHATMVDRDLSHLFLFVRNILNTWEDLVMPLTSTRRGSNNLPDFDETNVGYLFPSGTTAEKLYLIAQMPHAYKMGSTIYPHVHWSQGNSSNAVFNLEYKWTDLAKGDTAGFTTLAMGTTALTYVAGTTMHQLSTNFAGINGSGIHNLSSILAMKLSRNDTTYPGDALTYQFDIHYEKDSTGSSAELVK